MVQPKTSKRSIARNFAKLIFLHHQASLTRLEIYQCKTHTYTPFHNLHFSKTMNNNNKHYTTSTNHDHGNTTNSSQHNKYNSHNLNNY